MPGPKSRIYEQLAEVARTLGHAHRLELLEHIAQGERSVERLAELAGLSIANASQHLQNLRKTDFVKARRDGKHILYSLSDGPVIDLLGALQRFCEKNRAEVRAIIADYFMRLDRLEPVSRRALIKLLASKSVTLLDVRPEDEFAAGHIPGAMNVPIAKLDGQLRRFRKSQEIVAYCRGPYCVLSFEAVALLRKRGYAVRRLEDGFPEWKADGLPIEADAPL
jgi:rhodanese-related sulfurtransferase/DNA-binding transcriptional ArsR family regulator